MKFSKYLYNLQKKNRFHFSLTEALQATELPKEDLLSAISYFKKKRYIFSPFQGFYIVIPITEQGRGNFLPQDIVLMSMEYLKVPYYVGLLTAAAEHGATHQATFVFQVVSSKRIKKEIISGDTRIQFIYKKDISDVDIKKKVIRTGYLPVSTPEETVKDVMTYYRQCGGLNHQATVLSELTEAINTEKLISLAKRSKSLFWVQRMGYILEKINTFYEKDRNRVVAALEKFLATKKLRYVSLAPEIPTKLKSRNKKWHIIENTTVESDL